MNVKLQTLRMLCALVLLGVVGPAAAATALSIGQQAPDFQLPNSTGGEISLAEMRGRYVVLEWTNHDCPFVRKHYDSGNMQGLQKQWTAKDVVWLSVISSAPGEQGHVDAAQAQALTASRKAAPTAVLLDADGAVGRRYGAKTTPHMYVIDPQGQLIYQGGIDSIASSDAADIPKAKAYVTLALQQALAGKPVADASTRPYGCSVKY